MKVSKDIKLTYFGAALLFIYGLIFDDHSAACASIVIFVILLCTIEILEAIHKNNE